MVASPPAGSSRIYISYRREETAPYARLLREELSRRLGAAPVFMDVDSVEPGQNFVEVIAHAVGFSDVLLVLIGDRWLRIADSSGRRRVDDPHDLVRLEIEAALARRIQVIPILIDGARMPLAEQLPDSLGRLTRHRAFDFRSDRLEFDISRLIQMLELTLDRRPASEPPPASAPPRPRPGPPREDALPAGPAPRPAPARRPRKRRGWRDLLPRRWWAPKSKPPRRAPPARRVREPDGDVSFTAGYPGLVSPHRWYSLSVYVHLGRLQDEVDQYIADEARSFGLQPAVSRTPASRGLPRGTQLVISPEVHGVVFNPPAQEVRWLEDLQHVEFRMRATSDAAGRAVLGTVEVRAGSLLVGQVPLSVRVRGPDEPSEGVEASASSTTRLFRSIFASYAHEDSHVVRAFAEAYRALGIDMLVDKASLRAGDRWQPAIALLIEQADLFQLFWSDAASRSRYVAEEWQHALKLQDRKGERFIRPLYWSTPWPAPPAQLGHLHFAPLDLAVLASITGRSNPTSDKW
jgi:TIR domain